jgi:hypothetical protein
MSDPRDTDPRYADLKCGLDEAPSGGGSMWLWLAGGCRRPRYCRNVYLI